MAATIIMKSGETWYSLLVQVGATQRSIEPILQKYFNGQEAVENILNTCGDGIKVIIEIPEGGSTWNSGEYYDHSPDWMCSPLGKRGKAVAVNYYNGPKGRANTVNHTSLDEAIKATSKSHLFIWDGESWSYKNNTQPFKRGRGSAWSRSRTNKG